MITIKQINYALAVAETLHFKKAAEKCFVSPSTLSNAITEMEAQLAIQIFERNNKNVIRTNSVINIVLTKMLFGKLSKLTNLQKKCYLGFHWSIILNHNYEM